MLVFICEFWCLIGRGTLSTDCEWAIVADLINTASIAGLRGRRQRHLIHAGARTSTREDWLLTLGQGAMKESVVGLSWRLLFIQLVVYWRLLCEVVTSIILILKHYVVSMEWQLFVDILGCTLRSKASVFELRGQTQAWRPVGMWKNILGCILVLSRRKAGNLWIIKCIFIGSTLDMCYILGYVSINCQGRWTCIAICRRNEQALEIVLNIIQRDASLISWLSKASCGLSACDIRVPLYTRAAKECVLQAIGAGWALSRIPLNHHTDQV